jgi:Uncharacterized conserved protein
MIALALIYLRPMSRWSRRLILALVVGFWLISTRIGAETLVWGLGHGYRALQSADAAQGSQAVVVLGGGAYTLSAANHVVGVLGPSSILRVLEGARVAKMIGARVVVASGGRPYPELQLKPESEMIRALLTESGVAADRIVEESTRRRRAIRPADWRDPAGARHRSVRARHLADAHGTVARHLSRGRTRSGAVGVVDTLGASAAAAVDRPKRRGALRVGRGDLRLRRVRVLLVARMVEAGACLPSAAEGVLDRREPRTARRDEAVAGPVRCGAHPERVEAASRE